jgi:Rieske 2Fe-2S family protein
MSSRGYRHGWFAPMEDESLDIRRWLLPRLDARLDLVLGARS